MRVGLDIRWIFRETSGIGTYTRELVREFAAAETPHEFVLYYNDENVREDLVHHSALKSCRHIRFAKVAWGLFSPLNQLFMPGVLRRDGIEVFHSPNYMIPFLAFRRGGGGAVRCVVTLHDVIPLKFPEFTPRARKNRIPGLFRCLMNETVQRADRIIAVSECSRRDIMDVFRLFPEEAARVAVVPNFAQERVARPDSNVRTLLYVGRFDPYKNLVGLVEIFAEARKHTRLDLRLRVVGTPDPRYPEPQQRAAALGLLPWIDWRGYCAGGDLAREYAAADVFVLPSRYEGFGLTVLEAMACGTPVVCSDRASLPEVAGDAALLCDPDDIGGFAGAILRVLTDANLAENLAARGRERARTFTWARTARATLAVYEAARQPIRQAVDHERRAIS